jgi:hypothetical protein
MSADNTAIEPSILYWGTPVVLNSTENLDGCQSRSPRRHTPHRLTVRSRSVACKMRQGTLIARGGYASPAATNEYGFNWATSPERAFA